MWVVLFCLELSLLASHNVVTLFFSKAMYRSKCESFLFMASGEVFVIFTTIISYSLFGVDSWRFV